MAAKFDVPFLGKVPLDTNMLRCCESGKSFTDTYPDSPAAPAFLRVVDGTWWVVTCTWVFWGDRALWLVYLPAPLSVTASLSCLVPMPCNSPGFRAAEEG